MEEQLFDLNDFVVATKSNPRKEEEIKAAKALPDYSVKFNFKTKQISFDRIIGLEIGLENNSLAHARSKTGTIAIIVVPGNEGVFAKRVQRGTKKGDTFKNILLFNDLVDLNLTSGKYNLEKLTTGPANINGKKIDNCVWYVLKMVGEPQIIDLSEKVEEAPAEPLTIADPAPVAVPATEEAVEVVPNQTF